ncbi:uncharacterized protein BO88DRAFT_419498 [Aspergillus vadensis CBS 113365]|uniref:Uncharacterized protein n=1 Tax=Aspergillus vadensis (strain CBS 113365 / IMI 142717 / IBT 24658) TaxID=1448311 RepID=A0A319C636_ASPVC|nr:hypothetical protein BO88DRAFT_419498 [Aspergillus vadensis CBS 113365]PYH64292.1 hypothetical protein BO88DRAFT_419498 [Aspergillus vadensis CBS 113365]
MGKLDAGKAMICRLGGLGAPCPARRTNHHCTCPECRVLVQGLRATRRSPSQQWRRYQGGKQQERTVEHRDHPEHSYTEHSTITPAGSEVEHPLNTLPFLQRPGERVPMCLSDRVRIRLDLLQSRDETEYEAERDNTLISGLLVEPRHTVPVKSQQERSVPCHSPATMN